MTLTARGLKRHPVKHGGKTRLGNRYISTSFDLTRIALETVSRS